MALGVIAASVCGVAIWAVYSSFSFSQKPEVVISSIAFSGEEVRLTSPRAVFELKFSIDETVFPFTAPHTIEYQNLTGYCETRFGFRMFDDDRVLNKLLFDEDHVYEYKIYEVLPAPNGSRQITCHTDAPPLSWILSGDSEAIEPRPTIVSPFR